jgi:phospholipid/cholesterol/gamma-HCH transport system substrate-binding protein
MEIRRTKNAYVVGVFIVIAIAIFILTVFTLGGEKKTFTKKFPIKVLFSDINGLKEGNNVWFSGVKIGTVRNIDLKGKSNVEVTLSIEEKARPFVSKDARAKISTDGFLGNKIVIIYDGTSDSSIEDNGYLTVPKATTNEDILATLQVSNKNLIEITNDFKAISRKISSGEGTIGKLINDPSLVNSLQATVSNFKTVSVNSRKIIANMQEFTSQLNSENSSINKLLADTALYDSIRNAIGHLQTIANSANDFANDMNAVATNLKNASDQLSDTTKPIGMLLKDESTTKDLEITIQNLKSASKKLDQDLEAAQHNFLLRGYFKKHPPVDTTSSK